MGKLQENTLDQFGAKALYDYLRYKENIGLLRFFKPIVFRHVSPTPSLQFEYMAPWLTHQKLINPGLQELRTTLECTLQIYWTKHTQEREPPDWTLLEGSYSTGDTYPASDDTVWVIVYIDGVST
jgi:hypothetical protein